MYSDDYKGSEHYRPISTLGYIGYTLLFAVPVIGFVFMIMFSLSHENMNRRNLARANLCFYIAALIAVLTLSILVVYQVGELRNSIVREFPWLQSAVEYLAKFGPKDVESIIVIESGSPDTDTSDSSAGSAAEPATEAAAPAAEASGPSDTTTQETSPSEAPQD